MPTGWVGGWVGGWVDGWMGILIVNLHLNTMAQAKLNSKAYAGIASYTLMKLYLICERDHLGHSIYKSVANK